MTTREFYAEHADDGRAVVNGTKEDPKLWLTKPSAEHEIYCVCFRGRAGVRFVTGEFEMTAIRRSLSLRPQPIVDLRLASGGHYDLLD